MALELKLIYEQSGDGKQLILYDDTNWGGDNPEISNVDSATLIITFGEYVVELDLMDEFNEEEQEALVWEIDSGDFTNRWSNETLRDGIYNIQYIVETDEPETYIAEGDILLYYNVQLAVYRVFLDLNDNWLANLCDQKPVIWATNLWAALLSLEYSAILGNLNRVENCLEFVQKLTKSKSLYEFESLK